MDHERLIPEREAADLLSVKAHTLARWRGMGHGPPWYRIGRRLFYRTSEVLAYIESRRNAPDERLAEGG